MSKKTKYSVDEWSDTFTDKRKAKYGGLTKEEFNFGNKQLIRELGDECKLKGLKPHAPHRGINEGVLGMTATKYKKYFGVMEPLNDNLTVDQVSAKNMAMIMATAVIRHYEKPTISQPDGVIIGRNAALHARVILSGKLSDSIEQEAEKLKEQDKINEKRIANDFRAGKRPSLPD
jgi:hypothetical protein